MEGRVGRCHTRNFVEIPPQVRGPEPLKANNNNDVSVVVVVIVIAVVVVVVVVVVIDSNESNLTQTKFFKKFF